MQNLTKQILELKEIVGKKEPIEYFKKLADVLAALGEQLEFLSQEVKKAKLNAALAVCWDQQLAATMLQEQIELMRKNPDKELYRQQIDALKKAYIEGEVIQTYQQFCLFWKDTLGWHPFQE